jgi:DNA-directed RNA polymerase subunit omega
MMTDLEQHQYAGLTSQAAVKAVGNRYDLILIASRRAREISRGDRPRVNCEHGIMLTTLKEIEEGKTGREYLTKTLDVEPRRRHKDHAGF